MTPQIGDIALIHDSRWYNLVSSGIQAFQIIDNDPTGLVPYHIALTYSRYTLCEATWGKGVRFIDIREYTKQSYITMWFKRLREDLWPKDKDSVQRKMQRWMDNQEGRQYDRSQILGIVLYGLLKFTPFYNFARRKKHIWLDQDSEFICSELVARCYLDVLGVNPCPGVSTSNITPLDLDQSDLLVKV